MSKNLCTIGLLLLGITITIPATANSHARSATAPPKHVLYTGMLAHPAADTRTSYLVVQQALDVALRHDAKVDVKADERRGSFQVVGELAGSKMNVFASKTQGQIVIRHERGNHVVHTQLESLGRRRVREVTMEGLEGAYGGAAIQRTYMHENGERTFVPGSETKGNFPRE